jgi:hypothetical protein
MIGHHHHDADLFGRTTLVLSEHATLRQTVEGLRRRRANLIADSGPPPADLVAAVMDFARQLLTHFAAEERPEYFGAIVDAAPEVRDLVAELTAEHGAMRATLQDIRSARTTRAFLAHFAQLLEQFAAHERREAAMLEELFRGPEPPRPS